MPEPELWAGRYRRERLLGRGAMGEVWAAHDVVLDRLVAIKSIASGRTDPEDLDRMAREARVAARIGHPNAVGVYDLVTVDGRPNLVMEYVEGTTLADLIRQRGRLDPHEVAAIGAAVADALSEAHRLGVVHRDIKPANILITPRGTPKLADFGIARGAGDASVTATGATVGTPAYLAPEVVLGSVADAGSDVWSLGVTLYAALQGSSPFVVSPDDGSMVVLGRAVTMPIPAPDARGPLSSDVMAMLDRDPTRRPAAAAVAERLRTPQQRMSAADSTPVSSATSDTTRLPSNARTRRSLLLPAVAVLVVAAIAVTLVVLFHGGGGSSGTPEQGVTGQRYRGPADITTVGPTGWSRDPSDRSVYVADYLEPGSDDRHTGDYFRLGVYAPHAAGHLHRTASDARKSVVRDSSSSTIVSTTYVDFLGGRAVDIEWKAVNPEHVARHGIVRVWNSGGVSREIMVNTTAASWSGARAVFDQLTGSCHVSH